MAKGLGGMMSTSNFNRPGIFLMIFTILIVCVLPFGPKVADLF